jgi:hypothetical protein
VTHRFLEVNIFTSIQSLKSNPGVPMIWRGNDHRIDTRHRKDLAVIQKPLALIFLSLGTLSLLVYVTDRHNLAGVIILCGVLGEGLGVIAAPASAANKADVDTVISANNAAWIHF